MVTMQVSYEGDLRCTAVHGPSGDRLSTDAPVDNHGKGAHFSPTDLVATALATCAMTIMGIVAARDNIDISGATATVTKEMAIAPVRRIGRLAVVVTIPRQLPEGDRAKLARAADACPVLKSLHPDVAAGITIEYRT